MIRFAAVFAAALCASQALADDIERQKAAGTVAEAMERLKGAVSDAGATIFAEVDHGGGAAQVGMELGDSRLLIFGNPNLGTPIMQADMLAGLALPLKMLVYADADGQTWVAYEEIEETLDDYNVDDDLDVVEKIEGALEKFAAAAAGG